jgi:hypothetical protein
MRRLLLVLTAALLATSCAWTWDKVDHCDTGGCEECESDADCVVGASCCGESFFCMHRDEQLAVCQLACPIPREPACRCVEGRCGFD